ncbi:hypothetical protein NPX13_g514 [Xylaria arbuscula]|uniref:Uncharacterized protein n=1 Tax=Xylaria arbuscula TaxID=114810 RepID=A0A9W8TQG1_9PEZI|nr:hypothetical protein NPX13_g514 [Xylaria arbuscula]
MAVLRGTLLILLFESMLENMHYVKVLFDEVEDEVYLGYGDRRLVLRERNHPQLGNPAACVELRKLLRSLIHPLLDLIIMNKYNKTGDDSPIFYKQEEVLDDIMDRLFDRSDEGEEGDENEHEDLYKGELPHDIKHINGFDKRSMNQLLRLLPERRLAEEAIKGLLNLARWCRFTRDKNYAIEAYNERRELTEHL